MKELLLASILFASVGGSAFANSSESSGTTVSVETRIPGATAEVVEASVVRPIENALVKLRGVKEIRSRASEGRSYFEIYFKTKEHGKHLLLVRRAVEAVQPSLPPLAAASVVSSLESPTLK